MKKIALALLFAVLATPVISLAHPGHGETDGYSIIHYFIEPVHAVVTIGVVAVAFAYMKYSRRKESINK